MSNISEPHLKMKNHHQFRTKKSTCGRTPYFAHTPLKRHPPIRNPTARDPLPSKAHIGSSPAQCTFRDLSSALTQASQSSFQHPALSFPDIPPRPFPFYIGTDVPMDIEQPTLNVCLWLPPTSLLKPSYNKPIQTGLSSPRILCLSLKSSSAIAGNSETFRVKKAQSTWSSFQHCSSSCCCPNR